MNDLKKRAERNGKVKSIELKIEQTIKKLERMKDEYIQKAVQANARGETASYHLAKTAINASLTQIKRAKEMLLNIRITAELQKMGDVNADFLKGMSLISKRIGKVNRQSDFVKLQKEISKALSGMAEAQAGLDGFLSNSEAAFASLSDARGAIADERLDEFISGKVSEKELLADIETERIAESIGVAESGLSNNAADNSVRVETSETAQNLVARPFPSPSCAFDFSPVKKPLDNELSKRLGPPLPSPSFLSAVSVAEGEPNASVNTVITGGVSDGRVELIHTYVCSCLVGTGADGLKMLIADLSGAGLSCYNGIAHMSCDVVKSEEELYIALGFVERETERRLGLFKAVGARDVKEYNSSGADALPYIVLVIDGASDISNETTKVLLRIFKDGEKVGVYTVVGAEKNNALSSELFSAADALVRFDGGKVTVEGLGEIKPTIIDERKRKAVCAALGRDRV